MQQPGRFGSYPVGQAEQSSLGHPPKQRMMPFASALQTAFFPSQQFCEAFTVPLPPQMLPGGLQLVPFEHVGGELAFFWAQTTP